MIRAALVACSLGVALVGGSVSAQGVAAVQRGVTVSVYLSDAGAGMLALPTQAVKAFADISTGRGGEAAAGLITAADAGNRANGYTLRAYLASPSVVNLGHLNVTWQKSHAVDNVIQNLGIRLGSLNTTVELVCDGKRQTVLQLDSVGVSRSLRISEFSREENQIAARVEYVCYA